MAPGPNLSTKQWEQYQPVIYQLYNKRRCKAEDVIQILRKEHNLNVTERQLKLRLDRWGWRKKISASMYMAMDRVLKHYPGAEVKFAVPLCANEDWRLVTPHLVKKEVKRKLDNAIEKGTSPPDRYESYDEAVSALYAENVKIEFPCTFYTHDQARRCPQTAQCEVSPETGSMKGSESSACDSENDGDATREVGGVSKRRTYDREMSGYRPGEDSISSLTTRPQSEGQFPHPDAMVTAIQQNVFPQMSGERLTTQLLDQNVGIIDEDQTMYDQNPVMDITKHLSRLACDPANTHRDEWGQFLGTDLVSHCSTYDTDQPEKDIVQFIAYYIQQSFGGSSTLDDCNCSNRRQARRQLSHMLESNNIHLLTAVHWVNNVMGFTDKPQQLQSFFEDCWTCLDNSNSDMAGTLKPVIKFLLSMHQVSGNEELQTRPDEFSELQASVDQLRRAIQNRQHLYPTFLTVISYLAWYYLVHKDADQCMRVLLEHLPMMHQMMGSNHLVTITSQVLLSEAENHNRDPGTASATLRIVLNSLNDCAKPLLPYRYFLLEKLAKLQYGQGNIDEALSNLENVLEYRLQTLGPCSGSTWGAARMIFDVLRHLNRVQEAEEREQDLTAAYFKAYQDRQRGSFNPTF